MFAEDILKEFLLERREDVQKIMMFDLTYEKQMENAKQACGFQVKDNNGNYYYYSIDNRIKERYNSY